MPSTIRDDFVDRLGSQVGDEFYRLYVYWLEASVEFQEYGKLYDDKGNVDLLNAIGSQFFGNIQLMMQDSLILHLTRLTDPPESGRGYKNVSLLMLPKHLEENQKIPNPDRFRDPGWLDGLNKLLEKAKKKAEYARQRRNQRIAHLDYDTIMGHKPEPLKPFDFKEVEQILDSIYQVIRYVYSGMHPDTDLHDMIGYESGTQHFLGGIESLVHFLVHLDSLIDPEMKLDPRSDDLAKSFYNRFGIDQRKLDSETNWKSLNLFYLFRIQAKKLREKGV